MSNEQDSAVAGTWDEEDEELQAFRRVLVIPGEKLDSVIQKVKETFS